MLKQIVEIINEIRKEYPIIGNELDGKIYYIYADGGMSATDKKEFRYNGNTKALAVHLYEVFDDNGIYDEAIEDYMDVETYGYHAYMFEDEWEDTEW